MWWCRGLRAAQGCQGRPAELGFWEGPVCPPLLAEAPILPHPASSCLSGGGVGWSVHILLHKHSCHLPQLQLLTLSPAGRCFWISHKVALWGLGGSISAFKFRPYQHPDGAPCSPSHKDHPSLGLQKCGFHPFVCPAFIRSFHRNR